MKTIRQINKAFDKKFPDLVEVITGNPFSGVVRNNDVKEFYTQQILSLIEELEGWAVKEKDEALEEAHKQKGDFRIRKAINMAEFGRFQAFRDVVEKFDQMRATIREFFEIKD